MSTDKRTRTHIIVRPSTISITHIIGNIRHYLDEPLERDGLSSSRRHGDDVDHLDVGGVEAGVDLQRHALPCYGEEGCGPRNGKRVVRNKRDRVSLEWGGEERR